VSKITEDVFCDCGEYIAIKWLETDEIEVDSEVEHYSKDNQKVIAICPYCKKRINLDGKLILI